MDTIRRERWCREQHGVFSREHAHKVFGRYEVDERLALQEWYVAFRGWLIAQPGPPQLEPTVHAAALHLGPNAVASHELAAWLLGLDCLSPPELHFTVSSEHHGAPRRGLVVHRTLDLPPHDVTRRKKLVCTGLLRTVIDCAATSTSRRPIVALFESLNRRGQKFRDQLLERIESTNTGLANMNVLIDLARRRKPDEPATESAAESICDDILWRGGIRPERQFELHDAKGEWVARLDFAFSSIKLAIEVDGYATHKGRHAFYRDARRRQAILRCGWEVVPVVWADFDDESALVSLIGDIVAQRRLLFRSTLPIGPAPRVQLDLPF